MQKEQEKRSRACFSENIWFGYIQRVKGKMAESVLCFEDRKDDEEEKKETEHEDQKGER